MEHTHHDHEPKKQSALFSYIAALVIITGVILFINSMNCWGCGDSCKKKCNKEATQENHGESHDDGHKEGH